MEAAINNSEYKEYQDKKRAKTVPEDSEVVVAKVRCYFNPETTLDTDVLCCSVEGPL